MSEYWLNNFDWIIPTITSVILALVTAFISVISIISSEKTQKEAMRFQLFSKRYELYNRLKSLYDKISEDRCVTVEIQDSFTKLTEEAVFMFGEDVVCCCTTTLNLFRCYMHPNLSQALVENLMIERMQEDSATSYRTSCLILIRKQSEKMTSLMPRYLKFSKYKQRRKIINHNKY